MENILTPSDVERIAESMIKDFYGDHYPEFAQVEIERFAVEYCVCEIRYAKLSDSGRVLGVTSYNDINLILRRNGANETMHLPAKVLLIEEGLKENSRHLGRLRFSIAHECAHQLLYKIQKSKMMHCCRERMELGGQHTIAQIHRMSSPDEYNANQLAGAFLMPFTLMKLVMARFCPKNKPIFYGSDIAISDKQHLSDIASFLGVSKQALIIRLKELNMVNILPPIDDVSGERYAYD